jgi:hypothetical protein
MKNKYGIQSTCRHCKQEFTTKPRYVLFCSQACKNPHTRPGHIPWNKGLKLNENSLKKFSKIIDKVNTKLYDSVMNFISKREHMWFETVETTTFLNIQFKLLSKYSTD